MFLSSTDRSLGGRLLLWQSPMAFLVLVSALLWPFMMATGVCVCVCVLCVACACACVCVRVCMCACVHV